MFALRKFNIVLLFAAVVLAMTAVVTIGVSSVSADTSAVDSTLICTVDDGFNTIDPAWVTDRYAPNAFKTTFFDGDNRLEIGIDNAQSSVNRGGQGSIFYNTQGKKMPVTSAGEWSASAQLYVSADMLAGNNLRRSDMWVRTGDGSEANAVYHIIGIVRNDYADPWNPNASALLTKWRVWDGDEAGGDGWIESPGPTTVGWYDLKIVGNSNEVKYYIENDLVYTDNAGLAATPKLTEVFLQAYNFSNAGLSNSGQNYSVYWDNLDVNSDCPSITLQAADAPICSGPTEMTIDLSNVSDLYGYQFMVNYDPNKVSAVGSFDNTWFDANSGLVIPTWDADCSTGNACKFAVSLQNPAPAVSTTAPKTVAKIVFTPVAPGNFTVAVADVVLSDLDGIPIPVDVGGAEIDFSVCGQATVSGNISLQGRLTPMDVGSVKLVDTGGIFTDITVPFDVNGDFTIPSVPVLPTGSTYSIRALHGLYLDNLKTLAPLLPGNALTGQNTRLWGGDANNNHVVEIGDVTCIGGAFGQTTTMGTCGGTGSPDINLDLKVNIQDLSIAGGNYMKASPQNW